MSTTTKRARTAENGTEITLHWEGENNYGMWHAVCMECGYDIIDSDSASIAALKFDLSGHNHRVSSVMARPGTIKVGMTLPNGGLVLDVRRDWSQLAFGDAREQGFVLCMVGGGTQWAPEFATWSFVVDERGIVTVSGHYYGDLTKALDDLNKRSTR